MEAGDFADELQGSVADFVGSDRRIEVEQVFDIAAHVLTRPKMRMAEKRSLAGVKGNGSPPLTNRGCGTQEKSRSLAPLGMNVALSEMTPCACGAPSKDIKHSWG